MEVRGLGEVGERGFRSTAKVLFYPLSATQDSSEVQVFSGHNTDVLITRAGP